MVVCFGVGFVVLFWFQNTVVMGKKKKIKGRTIVSSALTLEQGSNIIFCTTERSLGTLKYVREKIAISNSCD